VRNDLDFIVANGENAAGGFGITPAICEEFFKAGVDAITTGNHLFDQSEIVPYLAQEKRLLRPLNYPDATPGAGANIYAAKAARKVAVLHVMGQIGMHESLDCPFAAANKALANLRLGKDADAIILDIHAEATSEKYAMGHWLDGRVSLVVGSHTHVPTNDAHILKNGTAYQTDAGMCGDYDSVIGMKKETPIRRFTTKILKGPRMEAASGEATVCGIIVETDDKTGLASTVEAVKVGGIL
jgi:metallophosphoesterase (TIGR00282 family)